MKEVIKTKNLYKIFNETIDTVALTDISISIYKGEYIALVGPNGSGKTTLLSCLGGYTDITSGSVFIENKNINNIPKRELSLLKNKKFGYIFQNLEILEFLTVKENLEIPLIISNLSNSVKKERVEKYVKFLKLDDQVDKRCSELSGGQKQKVAIGVALINEPEIIFADEPTSNLDKEARSLISEIFLSLNEQGKTIILVSHDLEVLKYVSRTIRLDKSYLIES